MDQVEAISLAVGGGIIVVVVLMVLFGRPMGGDRSKGREDYGGEPPDPGA